MGRIFNIVGLRWVPTRKIFTSNTTMVDSEPSNGSKEDINNPYKCEQTLNGFKEFQSDKQEQWLLQTTLQAPFFKEKKGVRFSALYLQKKRNLLVFDHSHQQFSYIPMLVPSSSGSRLTPYPIPQPPYVPPTKNDWDILFQPMFDEFFNPPSSVVTPVPAATARRPADPTDLPVSTSLKQDAPSTSTSSTQDQEHSPIISQVVEELPKTPHFHDDP
ncbi:hypothetical protein Tco_0935110 [Tanacetum coccineum]